MTNELKVSMTLEPVMCAECSVPYMMLASDLQLRRERGRGVFCPNGHETRFSAEGELAETKAHLEQALGGWEDQRNELQAQLEAAKERNKELEGRLTFRVTEVLELRLQLDEVIAGWRNDQEKFGDELLDLRNSFDEAVVEWDQERARLEATIAELQQKPEPEISTVLAYGSGVAPMRLPPELLAEAAVREQGQRQDFMPAPPDLPSIGAYADDDPEAHAAPASWRDVAEPKTCGYRGCNNTFLPNPNVAEAIWKKQKYCSGTCAARENNALAKERRDLQAEAPAPADAEPVADVDTSPERVDPPPENRHEHPPRTKLESTLEALRTNAPPTPETRPQGDPVPDETNAPGGLEVSATAELVQPEPEADVVFRGDRYPARFAELLTDERYEPKDCAWCTFPLMPKLADGKLEAPHHYAIRKTCPGACQKNHNAKVARDGQRDRYRRTQEEGEHIESLAEVRAKGGDPGPRSEEDEKKLDEQLRRDLATALTACPELLEEMENYHREVERATLMRVELAKAGQAGTPMAA